MIGIRNTNVDYSEAFKSAILHRLDDQINRAEDDALGMLLYNIARWAVADSARSELGNEDLICEIQLHILSKLPMVDRKKSGAAMIAYFKRAADNRLISIHRANSRQKRTGTLIDINDTNLATDFYGRQLV